MADETKGAEEVGATSGAVRDIAVPSTSAAEPQLPPTATTFAAKAKDLGALRDAVVDAASVGVGQWLSYLFVLFYLTIAVGSVTHRELLFEKPVKLPFLNVDLPLIGFFVLGPVLLLIVHTYVLLHLALLAGKVGAFDAELRAQIDEDDLRARLRRQLPSNIFVQFLAGPREVRTGVMGFLLRLIAWVSLVLGPLALFVFFQLQFLPYHHEAIAWWQRFTVVADLALLWMLWPSVARGETTRLGWRDLGRGKVAAAALTSLAPVLLVFGVATFPGEWLDTSLPSVKFVPTGWSAFELASIEWSSLHKLLVGGDVDFVDRKPISVWSNRLVLPGIDVIDHAKSDTEANIATLAETLSLRGRRLEGAVLIEAHLRKADFTGAHLQGADLTRADLREAKFECAKKPQGPKVGGCAQLQGATLVGTQLQGASLDLAQLQGAWLDGAQLQGATLAGAQLQGAELARARLEGASLAGTRLQGAYLYDAQLQGASLEFAELQGALLGGAQLQGATLDFAQLQGAWLDGAQLQGAYLYSAQLQGASLLSTQLQGTSFNYAQLQGAKLGGATQLQGASFSHIFAWRANVRDTWPETKGAFVVTPETRPKYQSLDCPAQQTCDWSASSFAALKRLIEEQVPGASARHGSPRHLALERIARLDPGSPLDSEEAMAKAWADLVQSSPLLDAYEEILAVSLRETGCDANGAPYVIRALLRQTNTGVRLTSRFANDSRRPAELAVAFLDEAQCSGARGLSEDDKVKLQKIRNRSAPPSPTHAHSTAQP